MSCGVHFNQHWMFAGECCYNNVTVKFISCPRDLCLTSGFVKVSMFPVQVRLDLLLTTYMLHFRDTAIRSKCQNNTDKSQFGWHMDLYLIYIYITSTAESIRWVMLFLMCGLRSASIRGKNISPLTSIKLKNMLTQNCPYVERTWSLLWDQKRYFNTQVYQQ